MHFAILAEDASGKTMLEALVIKILGPDTPHTFEIHSYKGIGHIPKGLSPASDPEKRILLDQLPRLLAGFGKTFQAYGSEYPAMVVVVCDLDDRDLVTFTQELKTVLRKTHPKPNAEFCIAIEEGEAWLLGDLTAVKQAFANAKHAVLDTYRNDSICGTWERLADALYPGGAKKLKAQGYRAIGTEKARWAATIAPLIEIDRNISPSFQSFVSVLHKNQVPFKRS